MRTFTVAFIGGIVGTIFASVIAIAWTGPTGSPPSNNVAAPVNVGTTDQVKSGGLGVGALAVFGNSLLSGTSRYLNFGTIPTGHAAGGYGWPYVRRMAVCGRRTLAGGPQPSPKE